jgi:hypothetical protein
MFYRSKVEREEYPGVPGVAKRFWSQRLRAFRRK